jgi:hypothetical protein
MKLLDFSRSFLFFEADLDAKPPQTVSDLRQNKHNRARIQIDCLCRITSPAGKSEVFYLGESCKAERCGCSKEEGLFIQPNADFRPVYSKRDMVIFKSWDKNNKGVMLIPPSLGPQPERQVVRGDEAFYRHGLQIKLIAARELKTTAAIIAAANAGQPLVARTVYHQAGFRVLLEYPVLTFNVSERHNFYQSDTGPVIFPELTPRTKRVAETFRLAFSAFNSRDWIEFIVQKPTPIGRGISVNHYSETLQRDCVNTIFATK